MPYDVAHRVGEPRGHTGQTWECNVWKIRESRKGTESASAHALLPSCVHDLLQRTEAVTTRLAQMVASSGGEFAIHTTSTFIPGINLSSEQLRRIADLGLSLDVDMILITADNEQA
jgi:hypothetical protein